MACGAFGRGITILLLAYTAFLVLSYSGFSNMLPALLAARGVSVEGIGGAYALEKAVVMAVSFAAFALSTYRKAYAAMPLLTILYGLLLALFAKVEDPGLLVLLVPLISGVYMSLRPFNRSLVNALVEGRRLGLAAGALLGMSTLIAAISTALFGALLQYLGLVNSIFVLLFFLAVALITQTILVRAVLRLPEAPRPSTKAPRAVVLDLVLLLSAISEFFEAAVAVYVSIILWDLLGGPLPTGVALSLGYVIGVALGPIMGALSDKLDKPVALMGLSTVIIAFSYFFLSYGYVDVKAVYASIALTGVAPALYIPNLQRYVKRVTNTRGIPRGLLLSLRIVYVVGRNTGAFSGGFVDIAHRLPGFSAHLRVGDSDHWPTADSLGKTGVCPHASSNCRCGVTRRQPHSYPAPSYVVVE